MRSRPDCAYVIGRYGNKRTGLVAALVFLDLNGVTILHPQGGSTK